MKAARIIAVGKLKTVFWQQAWDYYQRQIKPWRQIMLTEIRDANCQGAERNRQEGGRILGALGSRDLPVALVDTGATLTSPQFAAFLRDCDENLQKVPAFIIGGPFGLDQAVLDTCKKHISLSAMTWPHELARVLLIEQLYRGESILRHSRYHH